MEEFRKHILFLMGMHPTAQHHILTLNIDLWLCMHPTIPIENTTVWLNEFLEQGYITEPIEEYFRITQKGRNYIGSSLINTELGKKENNQQENQNREIIAEHLACLKGKWKNTKIMSDEDHQRLIDDTIYLLEHNTIPLNIVKIPPTSISTEFLRQTYYRLWKKNNTTDREKFVRFLHKVFKVGTITTSLAI